MPMPKSTVREESGLLMHAFAKMHGQSYPERNRTLRTCKEDAIDYSCHYCQSGRSYSVLGFDVLKSDLFKLNIRSQP